ARPLPDGQRRRAPVHSRLAARAPGRALPRAPGAVSLDLGTAVPDPGAFARLICDWCLEVQPAQQVLVRSTVHGAPLIRALHRAILERGAWPAIRLAPDGI